MKRYVLDIGDALPEDTRNAQLLVTVAPEDLRVDVAVRAASWDTWSPPIAVTYTDHDSGEGSTRYMGPNRSYVREDEKPGTLTLGDLGRALERWHAAKDSDSFHAAEDDLHELVQQWMGEGRPEVGERPEPSPPPNPGII